MGFDDDRQLERVRRLTDEVAGLVGRLTDHAPDESDDDHVGTVERLDGTSFESYAYFEDGRLLVAYDGDEEWMAELDDVSREGAARGLQFPDKDGSLLGFVPRDPGAFYDALREAGGV